MRWSRYYIPTLKEAPADAEVISHKLLVRAGTIIPGKGTAHSQIRKKKTAIISLIDEYPKTVFYSSEMNSS